MLLIIVNDLSIFHRKEILDFLKKKSFIKKVASIMPYILSFSHYINFHHISKYDEAIYSFY